MQTLAGVMSDEIKKAVRSYPQRANGEAYANATPAAFLASSVRRFVDDLILPAERLLESADFSDADKLTELAAQARAQGLFGLFFPTSLGGKIQFLEDYLQIGEEEGRSEHGPAIFGSEAAVDVYMMNKHGSAQIRSNFMEPATRGEAIPSYGMSEPESVGSNPTTIKLSAKLVDGVWRLNGRKWFVCRADRATFVTVVAKTDPDATLDRALSMIVVPMNAPGVKIERRLDIFGRFMGQCEISFNDAQAPEFCVLGRAGQGLDLMHERLGLGRIMRSAHWIGLAQRCFELMCGRICSERAKLGSLSDKQLIRLRVYEAHKAIASARALLRVAASGFDARTPVDVDIMTAKLAATEALCVASDSAVQIYGAEGVCDMTPLSNIFRAARATRFMDGADEALINAVGRRIINKYAGADA